MSENPPGSAATNGEVPADVVVDFDRLESLADRLTEVIHERAATWETQFDAGPGDVVSVKDAAWVIAKHLLTQEGGSRHG